MASTPQSRAALSRLRSRLAQAEAEYPHLAAPDGTVAVAIEDLRTLFEMFDEMRDTLALGREEWRQRWYGSPPMRGSSVVTVTGATIAYLGGNEETHAEVGKIVAAHNASLLPVSA